MGQLASLTSMDKGFLTTLVKNLQEKSLVQVGSDPQDSRKKIIILSKKGQKLLEKARDIPKTLLCMLGGDKAGPTEIAGMKSILDKLNQRIDQLET